MSIKQAESGDKKNKRVKETHSKMLLDEMKLSRSLQSLQSENVNIANEMFLAYPHINDPFFQEKITLKKELFYPYDAKIKPLHKEANEACFKPFTLSNHQKMVKHFLSSHTPYNGLLLYHGLGSGKTCSAIGITENMRRYMELEGKTNRIIIVASPNVQENFRLQLFDYTKLVKKEGGWEFKNQTCQGENFLDDLKHIDTRELSREGIVHKVNKIINKYYMFMGYIEFANYIQKLILNASKIFQKNKEFYIKTKLNKLFKNRMIVIDEIHNIRMSDESEASSSSASSDERDKKKVASHLLKLVKYVDTMKLLFLSATPIYNDPKEIVFLLNIFNMNDKRALIRIKDVFDKEGNLKVKDGKEVGKEILILKSRGYISYVRGENPYTFPFAVYPHQFKPENSIKDMSYPSKMFNGKLITNPLQYTDVYVNHVSGHQEATYIQMIQDLKDQMTQEEVEKFESSEKFGYNTIMKHLECLNMCYPNKDDGDEKMYTGKKGLKEFMTYKSSQNPPSKNNFKYKNIQKYGRLFSMEHLSQLSVKIYNIMNEILNSSGIVLVYSQYIDSGIIPICLALEELGFKRHGEKTKSLFYQDVSNKDYQFEKRDGRTMKLYSELDENIPKKHASYIVISGDSSLSPNNKEELIAASDDNNKDGSMVKVVLISQAGSEGLDFKNLRQVHIMEPWYNRSRLEQVIGRAIRNCSHKMLSIEERNVMVYQHVCALQSFPDEETADLLTYRRAEEKEIKISKIKRLLKENSIDCNLHYLQTIFAEMDENIDIRLSNGNSIRYDVGDKPFTGFCDYEDSCYYTCVNKLDIKTLTDKDLNSSTVTPDYYQMTFQKIFSYMKQLFKEQSVYTIQDLIHNLIVLIEKEKDSSSVLKIYEITKLHIMNALNEITTEQSFVVYDKYNRPGHITNIDYLFLFTPFELDKKLYSSYEYFHKLTKKDKSFEMIMNNRPAPVRQNLSRESQPEFSNRKNMDNKLAYIYARLNEKYELMTQEHMNLRGEHDIDKHFYYVYDKFMSNNSLDQTMVEQVICNYLIEYLSQDDIFELGMFALSKFWNKDDEPFELSFRYHNHVVKYFRDLLIEHGGAIDIGKYAIYFIKDEKPELYIVDLTLKEVRPITIEDERDFSRELQRYRSENREKLNNIVGYISTFKKKTRIFKTKSMNQANKGARCDNRPKKESLDILNEIVGKQEFTQENSKKLSRTKICLMQEMYLRYYQITQRNGKLWFLTESQEQLFLN